MRKKRDRSPSIFGVSSRILDGQSIGGYFYPRGFRILQALDEVAQELRATPAQVSLTWFRLKPTITASIASATSNAQLEDLQVSANLAIPKELIQQLDFASRYDTKSRI